MLLRYLLGSIFASQALADLTCADFVPHNWTSPLGRLYFYDTDPKKSPPNSVPSTLPAYVDGGNPLHLAAKGSLGGLFKLRTCNSTSLDLSPMEYDQCKPPDKRRRGLESPQKSGLICNSFCWTMYYDNLQIIHTTTGHCLTSYLQSSNATSGITTYAHHFTPCNADPQDTSQIYGSERTYNYYTDNDGTPYGVCSWNPSFTIYPEIMPVFGDEQFEGFELAADNKTLISNNASQILNLNMLAKHHDPLTTYQS